MTKTKLLFMGICLFAAVAAEDYFKDSSNLDEKFDCAALLDACQQDQECSSAIGGMQNVCTSRQQERYYECMMGYYSNFMNRDNLKLKQYAKCLTQREIEYAKREIKNMETAGDPCNKQNLECATDFACLVRFQTYKNCVDNYIYYIQIQEYSSLSMSLPKTIEEKDAFWKIYSLNISDAHMNCNINATRMSPFSVPIPATFSAFQNCYLNISNSVLPVIFNNSGCDTSPCIYDSTCLQKLLSMNCTSDGTSSVICNMASFSAFMASDKKNLQDLFTCGYNTYKDRMEKDYLKKETFIDPCFNQNYACVSDFKCLSRLAILNSCVGQGADTIAGSQISSYTMNDDKDAFWQQHYQEFKDKHDQCNKEATATDVLKDTIPDTFSAVQTCYLDYTNSADSANSALLSIVAIFSLIFLTS